MRYDAKAIGSGSEGAQTELQEQYNKVRWQLCLLGAELTPLHYHYGDFSMLRCLNLCLT